MTKLSTRTYANLGSVLHGHAQQRPNATAFVFLQNKNTLEQAISYAELDQAARSIADYLRNQQLKPGDRVVLLFPSGINFLCAFMGCLYAGLIAVPTYPPSRNLDVLSGIASDANASLILCDDDIFQRLQQKFPDDAMLSRYNWGSYTTACASPGQHYFEADTDAIAMLQYTSGSTGLPKGVMLSHRNLLANLAAIQSEFGMTQETVMVGWLPLYHDMGLIGNVLGSLYSGQKLYFMSPQEFVQEPYCWLEAISRYRAFISGGPNFAYQLCVDRISNAQLAELDLSSWQVAFNGAEPVRAQVLDQFSQKFYPAQFSRHAFQPCYGMAEASLLISTCALGEIPSVRHVNRQALQTHRLIASARQHTQSLSIVSCGRVIEGHDVIIADPETRQRCHNEQIGEIWVRGPSITKGYWNKPELNAAAFAIPVNSADPGHSYFRTGDLGILVDEQLYITGRAKDLIILRGKNYYPQDIELCASQSDPALKADGGAAFEVDRDGVARLVLVQEVNRTALRQFDAELSSAKVIKAIAQQFQIEVDAILYLSPQHLPKTSSGKVQRNKIRHMYLNQEFKALALFQSAAQTYATPAADLPVEDELTSRIRSLVAQVLRVQPAVLKTHQALLEQGVDSLAQLEISHHIETEFQHSFTVEDFFSDLSIDDICAKLRLHLAAPSAMVTASASNSVTGDSHTAAKKAAVHDAATAPMQFSLMFFSSDAEQKTQQRYNLFLSSAEFADHNGFSALWIPERHFHRFGGLYPNPAVVAAAAAVKTRNIRLRAGSVILPLHNPVRVAEEWAIVDNLSNGRVDLAFGQGWNPNDFTLAPLRYQNRLQEMYQDIETVKKLWRGESINLPNGVGEFRAIQTFPPAIQNELAVWITCSGGAERFVEAGARGANILTALLFQDIDELEQKLLAYRQARSDHGYDPATGQVSLMLHTYIGEDYNSVKEKVRQPLLKYLEDSIDLWRQKSLQLEQLSDAQRAQVLDFAFQRYFRSQSLCGTPESSLELVQKLRTIGVTEISCLLDFGIEAESVMASLWSLKRLKDLASQPTSSNLQEMRA